MMSEPNLNLIKDLGYAQDDKEYLPLKTEEEYLNKEKARIETLIKDPGYIQDEKEYLPLKNEEENLAKEKALFEKEKALAEARFAKIRADKLEDELERDRREDGQREFIQRSVWDLIKAWLACVLLLTLFSGIERGIPLCQRTGAELTCQTFILHYEKEVLVALISSPTVAIIGLAVIVLKYLFPNKESK